jgi:hypothetical protein
MPVPAVENNANSGMISNIGGGRASHQCITPFASAPTRHSASEAVSSPADDRVGLGRCAISESPKPASVSWAGLDQFLVIVTSISSSEDRESEWAEAETLAPVIRRGRGVKMPAEFSRQPPRLPVGS